MKLIAEPNSFQDVGQKELLFLEISSGFQQFFNLRNHLQCYLIIAYKLSETSTSRSMQNYAIYKLFISSSNY